MELLRHVVGEAAHTTSIRQPAAATMVPGSAQTLLLMQIGMEFT